MLIVDGQIHLWAKGTPSPPHRQEPYSAEQAIAAMDQGGVRCASSVSASSPAPALSRFLGAGLHLNQPSHFRGPVQAMGAATCF